MKNIIHKSIVYYLKRCCGAFHCYPYGENGIYVVMMRDGEYREYQKYLIGKGM